MLENIALILGGLLLLALGAEFLVKSACAISRKLGVSELFIGLTIVSMGTSAPEVIVSIKAALSGIPDIAVGNVVGSNIFNLLLILGVSAIVFPVAVQKGLILREIPIKLAATALLIAMAWDGALTRIECGILLALLVAFIGYAYWVGRVHPEEMPSGDDPGDQAKSREMPIGVAVLMLAGALAGLGVGANWLLEGSVAIAKGLGISELVIGLTLVAAGTSMPELFTSVVAALRRKDDIAVANVIGSNIFNILGILGISGLITPLAVNQQLLRFDLPFLLIISVLAVPLLLTGHKLTRAEGGVLATAYVGYGIALYMMST